MIELWWLTAGANAIIVVLYAAISSTIARGLAEGQWRSNPIAVATAAIFATCAIGHGLHMAHALPPWSLLDPTSASAAIAMFGDWRLIAWDALTGAVAIWYWVLRNRFAIVYQGASLCDDMVSRQRQAEQLRLQLVAGLAEADAAFEAGRRDAGLRALDRTLDQGKTIISTLMGETPKRGRRLVDLRRRAPTR